MYQFGRLFKVTIFGESHGPTVGVCLDGVPPGIPLLTEDFQEDLSRRQGGNAKGTTPRKEEDIPSVISGVFNNHTTGAPLLLTFSNTNVNSSAYNTTATLPRPSHADWVAEQKYHGFQDFRGSGHFSARLTTGIVATGVLAKKILLHLGIPMQFSAWVQAVGGHTNIDEGLNYAIAQKDTIGAEVHCRITGVPHSLGEPFWDSVESVLAHAMFAIPAVKGISFGAGFQAAQMLGLQHNDPIIDKDGTTATNNAGGIVGGITNGNEILFQLAFKPAASTPKPQKSLNIVTNSIDEFSIKGRHDLCVALRAPVIVEAMAAIVLLDFVLLNKSQNPIGRIN